MVIKGYSENVGITDVVSRKEYTVDNIPVGRLHSVSVDGKHYCIRAMNAHHVDDVWYNGRFIGDQYAVFVRVPCDCGACFYQQLTKWYTYYGSAVKRMCKIANVEYRKGE